MREITSRILTIILMQSCIFTSIAIADELSFQASVDRTKISTGDQLTLTISASGEDIPSAEPVLPPIDDFTLIGTNRSSSTQIRFVNGRMSSTKTVDFIYYLRPKRAGRFVIGSARIDYKGKSYRTEPINIEVVKGTTGGRPRIAPEPRRGRGQEVVNIADNLYLRAFVDKNKAYVGEQITITYKLYNRFRLSNVQYGNIPSYSGFWVEDLFDAQRLDFEREVVDGKLYDVAALKKVALFPTTSGVHTIGPMEVQCDIPIRSSRRSFFDLDDFFGRTQSVTVVTDPIEIEVLPLPEEGRPANFGGAVGKFSISATADPQSVAKGDPISLKVRISGVGNINAVGEPEIPPLEDFKVYEPKMSKTSQNRGDLVGGIKTLDYVLIPKVEGNLRIGTLKFSYFDLEEKRYASVQTQPISITVTPGMEEREVAAGYGLSREEIKLVGEDIRYIKPNTTLLKDQSRALYRSQGFLFLQIVPILAFLGALAYKRHLVRVSSDVAYVRRKRAKGEAARRLKTARKSLKEGSSAEFHAEVYKALSEFLANRLNIPAAGVTSDIMISHLEERGVEIDLVKDLEEISKRCDFARFAPSEFSEDDMRKLYENAERVIERLDRKI